VRKADNLPSCADVKKSVGMFRPVMGQPLADIPSSRNGRPRLINTLLTEKGRYLVEKGAGRFSEERQR
jgi:hypothetical protein